MSDTSAQAVGERIRELTEAWDDDTRARLLADLADPSAVDPTVGARTDLFGAAPTPDEVLAATVRNEQRLWDYRRRLAAESLTREQAAERLAVTPNQITNLVRDRHLAAFDHGGQTLLPAWQFNADSRRGRLEGIDRVAAVFPGWALSLSSWATTPNPALGGRTPAQALAEGDVDRVVAVAEHGR